MSKLLPLFLKAGICTAITCVTGVPSDVGIGMLGNFAYDTLKEVPRRRRLRPLGEPNGHLHHALARAISLASHDVELEKMIRDATRSLRDLQPPHHFEVEEFLEELQRKPEDLFDIEIANPTLKAFLEQPDRKAFKRLGKDFANEYLPGLSDELRTQIVDAIHLKIAARFWDEIKHDDSAWRAYSAEVFAEFRQRLTGLAEGQEGILALLEKKQAALDAAPAIPKDIAGAIDSLRGILEREFAELHQKIDAILASLGEVHLKLNALDLKLDALLGRTSTLPPPLTPHQLPPAANKFFGRTKEAKALAARLCRGKSCYVLGPAGMGKTALAAKVLEDLFGAQPNALAKHLFPQGIIFLDLYTLHADAESFWSSLANTLAHPGFLKDSPARVRATEACRKRRCLIVLEGAEDANGSEGRPTLPELCEVACQDNRWLILTRDSKQIMPAETIRVTDSLKKPEAARLFHSITAGTNIPQTSRSTLLDLLEGHPLALTWAASLLARGDEDPAELVREWQDDKTLSSLSDPLKAQHTLKWLFKRSAGTLDPQEAKVLEAAGLLGRAPFSLDALASAPGTGDARSGLKRLVQLGLLRLATAESGHWEFTHVLGYRFARRETGSDQALRLHLGTWLCRHLGERLGAARSTAEILPLALPLQHTTALLLADAAAPVLGLPLVKPLLHEILGSLLSRGRLDLARAAVLATDAWLTALPEGMKEDSGWQTERSLAINRLGELAISTGDLKEAKLRFSESLAISEKFATAHPDNTQGQRDLSTSHKKLGELASATGDLTEAKRRFDECLAIRERLVAAEPDNMLCQRDLSVIHNHLGNLAVTTGDPDEAAHHYTLYFATAEKLAAADPDTPELQRDLAISLGKLGDIALATRDFTEATSRFHAGLVIREKLAAADPGNTQRQRDLSLSNEKLGHVALATGDLDEAARRFHAGLAIRQKLATADPGNTRWQRDLSASYNQLGELALATGDLKEAKRRFGEDLAIAESLAAAEPGNIHWQRDLTATYDKLGEIAVTTGDLDEAARRFGAGLAICQKLAAIEPTNTEWRRDLSKSHCQLADLAEKQHDPALARVHWQAAHEALDGTGRRSLHLTPQDREHLHSLRQKIAGFPPE